MVVLDPPASISGVVEPLYFLWLNNIPKFVLSWAHAIVTQGTQRVETPAGGPVLPVGAVGTG